VDQLGKLTGGDRGVGGGRGLVGVGGGVEADHGVEVRDPAALQLDDFHE